MASGASLLATVAVGLKKKYDPKLVDELLEAYVEAKKNYYLGGLRLSAVEGGRFCEAALRMLQQRTTGSYLPLGKRIDSEKVIATLAQVPTAAHPESVRLHIPRAVRVVYDIRNKRDAAHLADGIDPNLQDATLVVSNLDWIVAEFTRLDHGVAANEAQKIVESLVTRAAPSVQDFQGFLKVLNPRLTASEHSLLLLYQRGPAGATYAELEGWARPPMRNNLRRTLGRLTHDQSLVHFDGSRYFVTATGMQAVERRKLYQLP